MSTESTIPALLRGLVDDAALFPPGDAPMPVAVAEHRRHRAAPYRDLVGRFLCRDSDAPDWLWHLTSRDRLRAGLIADHGVPEVAETLGLLANLADPADPYAPDAPTPEAVVIDAVEVPLPADTPPARAVADAAAALAVLPGELAAFVEWPRGGDGPAAIEACARHGVGAKLRTGGLVAAAFPTDREVADFVTGCVAAGVPFKCTAGLHRAVRHVAPDTGYEHHGFLNLLLATHAAVTGGDVVAAVAERDAAAVAKAYRAIEPATAARIRELFVGYGSCSVAEPLTDLVGLGLLDRDLLAHLPVREESGREEPA